MKYSNLLARSVGVAALLVATASPAMAQSREDRARVAITEARTKIDAAVKTGATGEVPTLVARAEASLRDAEEQFHRDHNASAIDAAHQASLLADQALGLAERNKQEASVAQANRTADAEAQAAASQQQAAAAQANAQAQAEQRAAAENAAAGAQAEAAAANDRAAAAQQAASNAAADAAAARAAAATPTTTVTVERETRTPAYSVKRTTAKKPVKKVVRKSTTTVRPAATTKTTTTIKTEPAPQ